jgi:outer membrane protein OmpA-like peptidoglycan-associated protein
MTLQHSNQTDGAEIADPTIEPEAAVSAVRPKAKASRPRPCFDDGALTRTFKFPSRTHPKSTYYVTSSEVTIHIKKARKKWKLVIPKKRIVAYRTNRWFAKPRWIELDLTFTQATRLGLVEPRKKPADGDTADLRLAARPAGTPAAHSGAADAAAEAIEGSAAGELDPAAETAPDTADIHSDDDTSDFDLVLDLSDDVTERVAADEHEPQDSDVLTAPEQALQAGEPRAVPPLARPEPSRSQRPTGAWLMLALALLMSGVGARLTLDAQPTSEIAELAACPSSGAGNTCMSPIVTGAIATQPSPQVPDKAPPPQLAVTTPFVAAAAPTYSALDAAEVQRFLSHQAVPPAPSVIDTPPVMIAMNQPSAPSTAAVEHPACQDLAAEARAMAIRFDYASPQLDRAAIASLSALAAGLQRCPSLAITIEGHTDSDGHGDRNETLSWRRAEAVLLQLVADGVKREQLSAIGYGHSRPQLPNASPESKRQNRRVTLVVERIP